MCFGCSKEPSHRDVSLEYPQHMFWLRNKNNNFQVLTLIWGPDLFEVSHHEIFTEKLEKKTTLLKTHKVYIFYNLCSLCSLKFPFLTVANVFYDCMQLMVDDVSLLYVVALTQA